jgi:NADPH2:quinone reductase
VAPLPGDISLEDGSMMLVNPMTAMAFILLARKEKHKAMVNNAAASSLGKMLMRLCDLYGIPLINIVRKEEHLQELTRAGADHVLNSQSPDFASDLKHLAAQLEATLFLDAVTGNKTTVLLNAAPSGTKLVAYARLSGENITADPVDLITEDKIIVGFQLGNWLHQQSLPSKLLFLRRVKKHLGRELRSTIRYRAPLKEVEAALEDYQQHMSQGKIILKP